MEVNGQIDAPAALLPAKEPLVLIVQVAGWAPLIDLDVMEG
jgi:hypothetical protein